MKIGIDCRMIEHPGIGRYLKNLVESILKIDCKNQYYLFFADEKYSSVYSNSNVSPVILRFPIYSLEEQIFVPFFLHGLDVFHSTHYNAPIFARCKIISTVHDLIHLIFPEYLSSKLGFYYAKFMFKTCVNKSRKIISVSENTKKDMIRMLGADAKKIDVIYEAVDKNIVRVEDEILKQKVREKYSINGSYVLYVGSLRYHKNVVRLIESFCDIKKDKSIVQKLVLGGRLDKKAGEIKKILSREDVKQNVCYIGEVENIDLSTLYSMADIFVFPSLYEGFGLPPLEAMACGTCVCASNAGSIPEILKDAALYFDPYDKSDISRVIFRLIKDKELRASLVSKGYNVVKDFSWETAARETIKVYEQVLKM